MTVRVDYRCQGCGWVEEVDVATPTPTRPCTACGAVAKRRWSSFGIRRGRSAGVGGTTPAVEADLCRSHPGVPGLCLLSDSAGRALVARAENDGRSLEREQRRQADHLDATGTPSPVVSDHGHGHSHGDGVADIGPGTVAGPREI